MTHPMQCHGLLRMRKIRCLEERAFVVHSQRNHMATGMSKAAACYGAAGIYMGRLASI